MSLSPLLAGYRRIFLREFAVQVSIGIHPSERAAAQRVLLDVDLWVADAPLAADDIAAVVDYDFLSTGIQRLVADRHFELQETLADAILDLCLGQAGVAAARVRTSKPDVYADCAAVGVERFRASPAFRAALGRLLGTGTA